MYGALRRLVQEVVERCAEQQYLKNLAWVSRWFLAWETRTYRIHVTEIASIYKTARFDERHLLFGIN